MHPHPVLVGTPSPLPLTGAVQEYSWGSRTALFELLGRPPSGRPGAEYWLGAHPAAPALAHVPDAGPVPLDEYLHRRPHLLGGHGEFPFLLKVLAAERPLSLQVHPDRRQAEAGFAEEEAAGVAASSPRRRYCDPCGKPELLVALTPFRVLAGIRDPAVSLEVVAGLGCPALTRTFEPLARDPGADGVRSVLERVLTLDPPHVRSLDEVLAAAVAPMSRGGDDPTGDPVARAADLVRRLRAAHPLDAGVFAALLFNDITLAPMTAVSQPPGRVHACVEGLGIEVMASSDNVIRGGLTRKHVDVPEFLRILDPTPDAGTVLTADPHESSVTWSVPGEGIALQRIDVASGPVRVAGDGPRVLLAASGVVELTPHANGGRPHVVRQGEAAFLPPGLVLDVDGRGVAFCAGASADVRTTRTSTTVGYAPRPRFPADSLPSGSTR